MGRRPDPTHLKLVKGITRKDRLNPEPPPVVEGVPKRPNLSSKAAMACWRELVGILQPMGVLATSDASALSSLAETQAEVDDLRRRIANNGSPTAVVGAKVDRKTGQAIPGTGRRRALPEIAMLRDAERRLSGLRSLFGLDPTSRARVPKNVVGPNASGGRRYF